MDITQHEALARAICAARHYPAREVSDDDLADTLYAAGVRIVTPAALAAVLALGGISDPGSDRTDADYILAELDTVTV